MATYFRRPRIGFSVYSVLAYAVAVLLFCEWFVYWVVLFQCSWPELEVAEAQPLRAMFLADTHLLGSKHGHWFDKLRREWQMRRSFQTAMSLFKPDVVFILGDLFDEGDICDDKEWSYFVSRLKSMFAVPTGVRLHLVAGNHDIGFHYKVESNPKLFERFIKTFNVPSVHMVQMKGTVFVLVNSMALEGDSCNMCEEAEMQLKEIEKKLSCESDHDSPVEINQCKPYSSPPILLQHFPLYRKTEENCTDQYDSPPEKIRRVKNRQRMDVLSAESSAKLLSWIKPRLIIDGHTHYSCSVTHKGGLLEITVPSFSWRNIKGPSFLMATITPRHYQLSKCYLPHEKTVIRVYMAAALLLGLVCLHQVFLKALNGRSWRRLFRMCCPKETK